MSNFRTLNLRESTKLVEKSMLQKEISKSRQKTHLQKLFTQKFLTQFAQVVGLDKEINGMALQTFVAREVEAFINREEMTEKNLRLFQLEMQQTIGINSGTPINYAVTRYASVGERKLMNSVSQSQDIMTLPKIATARENQEPDTQNSHQRQRLSLALRSSAKPNPKSRQSFVSPYGNNNGTTTQFKENSFNNTQLTGRGQISSRHQNTALGNSQKLHVFQGLSSRAPHNGTSLIELKPKLGTGARKAIKIEEDEESVLSQLSENEWVEIVKYEKEKFEEEKLMKVESNIQKRRAIKENLDKQLKEKKEEKIREIKEKAQQEEKILQRMKENEEAQQAKDRSLKDKMFKQKELNEQQLLEAKIRKEIDSVQQKQTEKEFVTQLKLQIDAEKSNQRQKRLKEKESAQMIIQENQEQKLKLLGEKEKDKDKQNQMIEEYNKTLEAQEQKRKDEIAQRENKIKGLMGRMADTVIKRKNDMEQEIERKAVQYQKEKESRDEQNEFKKKEEMRRKYADIQDRLQTQQKEKQMKREHELFANEEYMKKWNQKLDEEARKRKEIDDKKTKKKLEVKDYQLMQMGEPLSSNGVPSVISMRKKIKTKLDERPMNVEEFRLNKGLLKEISQRKKDKMGVYQASQIGPQSVQEEEEQCAEDSQNLNE